MKVNISSLLKKAGNDKTYQSEWDPEDFVIQDEDIRPSIPMAVDFHLLNAENHVWVEGNYSGEIKLRCSRCLGMFDESIQGEIEAKFFSEDSGGLPESIFSEDQEIVAEEGGVYLDTYEENTIDLGDVVRQDIIIQSPMQPLCKSDCEGLCPVCGKNRNKEDCEHETDSIDPRLSALQEIDISEENS